MEDRKPILFKKIRDKHAVLCKDSDDNVYNLEFILEDDNITMMCHNTVPELYNEYMYSKCLSLKDLKNLDILLSKYNNTAKIFGFLKNLEPRNCSARVNENELNLSLQIPDLDNNFISITLMKEKETKKEKQEKEEKKEKRINANKIYEEEVNLSKFKKQEERINELEDKNKKKEKRIKELEDKNEKQENKINELEDKNKKQEKRTKELEDKNKKQEKKIYELEDKSKKQEKIINEIKNDNLMKIKKLEQKDIEFEKSIKLMNEKLSQYLSNNINYNYDNMFQKLGSKIITDRRHLECINSGIKKLFNKNMKDIILKHEYEAENNPLLSYKNNCKNLNNVLLLIKTSDNRNFGAFYQANNIDLDGVIEYENENENGNEIIFYSILYHNSFIFSLDDYKIYKSNSSQKKIFEYPCFSVVFNNRSNLFCGTEDKINILKGLEKELKEIKSRLELINNNAGPINQYYSEDNHEMTSTIENGAFPLINLNNINEDKSFILSWRKQFFITNLEVYEIIIDN